MAKSDRRTFLKAAGAASTVALAGCDGFWRGVSRYLGADLPDRLTVVDSEAVDPVHHVLSRLGFGPWPGDLERVRTMGIEAYLEEQLSPESIDDSACEVLARRFESIHMSAQELYEFKKPRALQEITRMTLLRAVYSRRQLYEAMVHFWTDHFNIDMSKSDCAWLKIADDRDVIRKHALGNLRDLLYASATSPAMLVYLDGRANKKSRPEEQPNENYGRELLELHTLGVHGGYSQKDVMEAARCLTGWTIRRRPGFDGERGLTMFRPDQHDDGEKTVLGVTIPAGGGRQDLDALIDIVAVHPSTYRYIAAKLVRRFVEDEPPAALVERAAEAFRASKGDIKALVRTVIHADEFRASAGRKLKRPFGFVVSALRALGADTNAGPRLIDFLVRMGHAPFSFPTPDGYPDEATPWLGTMLWRWNFAVALTAQQIGGTRVDLPRLAAALGAKKGEAAVETFMRYLLGRRPTVAESNAIFKYLGQSEAPPHERRAEAVGLLLASPGFQRC